MELKGQYTQGGEHRTDDEVGSRRTGLPPPTGPRMDDKPEEEPRSVYDERENAEQVSKVIHYVTRKRAGGPPFGPNYTSMSQLGVLRYPTRVIVAATDELRPR
jgi:hypothetical protein